MRTLLAIFMILGAGLAAKAPATALASQHEGQPGSHVARQVSPSSDRDAECAQRAQAADPSGKYAGYPCWARYGFGMH